MDLNYILILLIIHFICDFLIQNNYIVSLRLQNPPFNKLKIHKSLLGNLYHTLQHFALNLILFYIISMIIGQPIPYKLIILISLSHFIIDQCKSIFILKKPYYKESLAVFIIDQLLHIFFILFLSFKCNLDTNIILRKFYDFPTNLLVNEKILITILIIIICTWVASIFIKFFINSLNNNLYKNLKKVNFQLSKKNSNESGAKNGGFIIGVLERLFIILVISINQPSMIGFVLTAKSIARFKKLEEESFAEYFIIGTFISFIIGILGGIIILKLEIIPSLN